MVKVGADMGVIKKESGGDYPLTLLIAVKKALFCCCEDPQLEDARKVLDVINQHLSK
jgi:hypothetical protein